MTIHVEYGDGWAGLLALALVFSATNLSGETPELAIENRKTPRAYHPPAQTQGLGRWEWFSKRPARGAAVLRIMGGWN